MAFSKIILNGVTQIDLTQDTVAAENLISPNTAHGADGLAIVGEATGGGNEFIITLSKNSTTGYWEPDKTFAEMEDAFEEEKIFVVKTNVSYTQATADGDLGLTESGTAYSYEVHEFVDEYPNPQVYVIDQQYTFRTSGLTKYFEGIDYDTYDGDALANEVPNGKIFYNSTGRVIGSATSRVSSDLTVSGATVTAPAGFYSSDATKTISSGSAATPATSITANPTISVNTTTGLITASTSASQSVTPTVSAGYVSSGTAGTVSISGSNTSQLSTQDGSTIAPTESEQTAVAANKYTLGAVKIGAISSTYIGSGIDQNDSDDLTVSGATVTAPAGYYASSASKSVASGSATTPSTTITADPSISINSSGLITATTSESQNITPSVSAGYVSSGTAGTVTVSGSKTQQLTTQAAKTVTPTESEQTAVASGVYTTGIVKVGAISSTYVGSGIDQRDDTDLTVSGATVTVPSGYYADDETKSVASGTAGTPTATKGTVSNHQVSVTPSVTNTTGYITGGTKTGTAVTVTASELASGNKAISSNGTNIDVVGYSTVSVDVQPSLQSKTGINPTTSSQTISPDSGYYGLSSVQINAMPTMTLPTSASSSATSGYTSKATIGRSTSAQYINIPTGYNSAGAYYTISATPNGSVTAPTSISGTSATVSTGTNTLTLTKTVSVTPNVTTAGYISSGTAGNSSVSLTASVNIRSSSDLTASGDTVTAPAGYYSSAASKAVSSMTLPTSATSSATSGFTSKATISRSTSDQYINIPTGYNSAGAYYKINAVANGTEGTPTATKGTVSNHSISVTPSVTNTAGYISGGTRTGTAVTVTASELASGNKAIVQNGTGIDVVGYSTVSVAVPSDGDFTRIEIVPQQTFTPDSNRQATVTGTSAGIVDGAHYGVTYDGVLWVVTCETLWGNNFCIGDVQWFFSSLSDYIYPFGVIWMTGDGTSYTVASATTGQHSIKIERLVFNNEGTVLGTKSITSNGTYNASTDSLDGYSSVTVNVPSSESTFVITLSYNSSTSKWESNKTYSEIQTAYNAGKTIVVNCTDSPATVVADGYYVTSNDTFVYWVRELRNDGVTDNIHEREYIFSQTGLTLENSALYCNTHGATLNSANQMLQGVSAYSHGTMYVGNIPNITLPSTASSTSSGTSKATITADTSDTYLNIPAGYNSTAQYYTIAAASSSGVKNDVVLNDSVTSNVSSITFENLLGEPTSFVLIADGSGVTLPSTTPYKVGIVTYDGTNIHAQIVTNTSNAQATYDSTSFSKSYSNGTLTISISGNNIRFQAADTYALHYTYGGSPSNVKTKDVQVGSGVTSITFTDIDSEPSYWSLIFKSNVGTSSGYQRVIGVYDYPNQYFTNIEGYSMDSYLKKSSTNFTKSYNNGSLTITSTGTNAGGYFHQPGYYQLTYVTETESTELNLQAKTNISPTTSSQTITADSGYDGLSSVQINAMPTMTLPSSASSTSSGTSKATISRSTSNQYINIPTGYNSTAQYYTISATPNMTLPTAASSTSSGTAKATITPSTLNQYINIPTGYNGTAQYYTISAVTYSTIRTGTTTPASSLGSNGDVYIKTS